VLATLNSCEGDDCRDFDIGTAKVARGPSIVSISAKGSRRDNDGIPLDSRLPLYRNRNGKAPLACLLAYLVDEIRVLG